MSENENQPEMDEPWSTAEKVFPDITDEQRKVLRNKTKNFLLTLAAGAVIGATGTLATLDDANRKRISEWRQTSEHVSRTKIDSVNLNGKMIKTEQTEHFYLIPNSKLQELRF